MPALKILRRNCVCVCVCVCKLCVTFCFVLLGFVIQNFIIFEDQSFTLKPNFWFFLRILLYSGNSFLESTPLHRLNWCSMYWTLISFAESVRFPQIRHRLWFQRTPNHMAIRGSVCGMTSWCLVWAAEAMLHGSVSSLLLSPHGWQQHRRGFAALVHVLGSQEASRTQLASSKSHSSWKRP
jgi:hypothetical protein